ncbi:hypothetical protein HPB51_003958 [Rhipicephalus microplus]|uniref:T-box domain-containing protein n=1 Tax=Rhipicephalus microplus TaxID=6941 RepID=A0A9J6D8M6_RHIMP|nr:hypothetical protein HPB51_003958 [Rhipicephalus microplus]
MKKTLRYVNHALSLRKRAEMLIKSVFRIHVVAERLLEEPEEASPGSAGECRLATASSPAPSSDAPLSPCESRSPSPCRSTVSPAVSTQGEDGTSSRDSGAGTSGGGGGSSSSKTSNNPYAAGLKPRCNSEELVHVDCHLENKDLWDKFHDLGTEMIITKSGRHKSAYERTCFMHMAGAADEGVLFLKALCKLHSTQSEI